MGAAALVVAVVLSADRSDKALEFVEALERGKPELAHRQFARVVAEAMDAVKLAEVWSQVQAQAGPYGAVAGSRAYVESGFDVVRVRCVFGKGPLDVKLVFDAGGQVSGLWFVPTEDASRYVKPGSFVPLLAPPAPPKTVRELEVTVAASPEWPLPGTLSLPAQTTGKVPAVVLVHGSGPNDRDESIGANHPFRDLAWGLAERGVAVLRYEKRTRQYVGKLAALQTFTVRDETVDDAVAALALLSKRPEVDPARVFVLGHSLGGYLVPRIVAARPGLAGAFVLAGSARPLERLIVEQARYLGTPGAAALEAEAQKVPMLTAASIEHVLGAPASYWVDLKGYDPIASAKKLGVPLWVLHGGRDYQVTQADFARWKSLAGKKVTAKLYPRLNHLFIAGEGKSLPAEYATEGRVATEVLDDLAGWARRAP